MKAFITTYNKTDKGLVLRNNFINELMEYDLKEFLMDYNLTLDELNYQVNSIKNSLYKRGYSSIIEAEKEFVYHIRFVS
jgi:hypothetical protein